MPKRLILHNGDVVSGEDVLREHTVAVQNGRIEKIFPSLRYEPRDGDETLDCSGCFVCPGFIDLHNQGGGGYSVADGAEESVFGIARAHAEHGTAGLLLTPPIVGEEWRLLLPVLAAAAGKRTGGAAVLGIHAEGPFLNPKRAGCMPRAGIMNPDPKLLEDILVLGGGKIVEMTIAPELPGSLDLILTLARNGVVASLGHSDAALDDVLRAIDRGASHTTHFFNAMSPLHHREPGLAGAALYSTDLSVELVADGHHVHPWIMGLTVQNKTVMLTCLVTDAMSPTGLPEGEYESLGMKVISRRGRLSLADHPETLAGSVLTMDQAVANMINMTGMSISDAAVMASTTPASVLRLEDRKGRIESGYDADITVLDRRYDAAATVVGGEAVFVREKKRLLL